MIIDNGTFENIKITFIKIKMIEMTKIYKHNDALTSYGFIFLPYNPLMV